MKIIFKILFLAFAFCFGTTSYAQTDTVKASFPGGSGEWRKYLQRNVDPMVGVRANAPMGIYTVVVSFQVDEHGLISKVKADNDPGYGYAKEAERIIKRGPKWIPATINNQAVIFTQKQSITFVNR